MTTLRPAIEGGEAEAARIEEEILRTPPRWANAALLLGLLVSVASVASGPSGYGLRPGASWATVAAVIFHAMASMIAVLAFMLHAIYQLRLVARVHATAVRVDVFRLAPLYGFASLTAWTGIALVACVAYGLGLLVVTVGEDLSFSIVDTATIVGLLSVAVALFVAPLLGLHDRISDEKARRLAEANLALSATIAEIHRRIAAGELEAAAKLNDAVAAANATVAAIGRVSTWPWRPETLRGFVSALGLPIALWLITEVLRRVIDA